MDVPDVPSAPTDSNRLRGRVLRAWREFYGETQRLTAQAADLSDASLSEWELGQVIDVVRAEGLRRVNQIGQFLEEPRCLPDMWGAVGTRDAIRARSDWSFNYADPGPPCWLWIRGDVEMTVDLQWGMGLHGRGRVPAGAGGLVVQFPTSVRNPPLEASLSEPGWVDTGRGEVPRAVAEAVGAVWADARDLHDGGRRPSERQEEPPDLGRAMALLGPVGKNVRDMRWWAGELGVRWKLIWPHLLFVLRPAAPGSLGGADVPLNDPAGRARFEMPSAPLLLGTTRARLLRQARGLSRDQAAEEATQLEPEAAVTREAIRRLEVDGRLPPARLTLTRLDRLYNADGRFAVERTYRSDEHPRQLLRGNRMAWSVEFPDWWLGPIWLRPTAPAGGRADKATVKLTWGLWVRKQRILSGMVLTTRKAPRPPGDQYGKALRVVLPHGWSLDAGVGAVPAALDIGRFWRPSGWTATRKIIEENVEAVNVALGRRPPPDLVDDDPRFAPE